MNDLSVGRSVQCIVEKTADRIRMPFGIIGRTVPGMRQVVGGSVHEYRGILGANFGRAIVTNGDFKAYVCDNAARGPLPKLLWQTCLLF